MSHSGSTEVIVPPVRLQSIKISKSVVHRHIDTSTLGDLSIYRHLLHCRYIDDTSTQRHLAICWYIDTRWSVDPSTYRHFLALWKNGQSRLNVQNKGGPTSDLVGHLYFMSRCVNMSLNQYRCVNVSIYFYQISTRVVISLFSTGLFNQILQLGPADSLFWNIFVDILERLLRSQECEILQSEKMTS